jgi:flavodoxin
VEVIEMRALVVYESMFGNTRLVAQAVADGLSSGLDVDLVEVAAAPTSFDGVELVVVGGPTHALGMTRQRTRDDARRQGEQSGHEVVSKGIGMREWLDEVRSAGTAAAAFDTRVGKPRIPGSAARGAAKRLRSRGFRSVARPESFWVSGTFGPLAEGEVERARRWGEQLASAVAGAGQGART